MSVHLCGSISKEFISSINPVNQSIKQANKQACMQAINQASKHSINQSSKQLKSFSNVWKFFTLITRIKNWISTFQGFPIVLFIDRTSIGFSTITTQYRNGWKGRHGTGRLDEWEQAPRMISRALGRDFSTQFCRSNLNLARNYAKACRGIDRLCENLS